MKILSITLFLWTLTSLGVIDYSISLNDREAGKVFYFLGDNHSKSDKTENVRQLKKLKDKLHAYEDRGEQLEILIENPSTLAKRTRKESGVLLSLYDHVRKSDLLQVSIEDIDVRRTANAAYFLLSTHYPGFDYSQPFNDGDKPLDCLRFKDIYQEYESIDISIQSWNSTSCKPILQRGIKELLELSNENHEVYRKNLEKFEISENDTILPWAIYQNKHEESTKRKTLAGGIYNTFAPLLEAYTLQKIVSSDSPTLVAIAGTHHIKTIQSSIRILPEIAAEDKDFLSI